MQDFFIDAPEHLLQRLVNTGHELQKCVEEIQKEEINQALNNIRTRWDEVLNHAPLHLLKVTDKKHF